MSECQKNGQNLLFKTGGHKVKKITFANITIILHNEREEKLMSVIQFMYDYTIEFYTDSNDDVLYHNENFFYTKVDEIETLLAALYVLDCTEKPVPIESMLRNEIEKKEKSA